MRAVLLHMSSFSALALLVPHLDLHTPSNHSFNQWETL